MQSLPSSVPNAFSSLKLLSVYSCVRNFKANVSQRAPRLSYKPMTKSKKNEECTYIIADGVRSVVPYFHEFTCFAKGRWLGRGLLEVLSSEFGAHPKVYWENAIRSGRVRVNDKVVDHNYIFKNSDSLKHRTHRHEPPVSGEITLVGESEELLAISKPASMPIHACGSYKFNSLMHILLKEPVVRNQPHLYPIHRLDRVTSGLILFAKTKEVAAKMSKLIRDRTTSKTYLARVKGKFPKNIERLKEMDIATLLAIEDEDEDDGDKAEEEQTGSSYKEIKLMRKRKYEDEVLTPSPKEGTPLEELFASPLVGYCFGVSNKSELFLRCPVGTINHRQGVGACLLSGKPSVSSFVNLGYHDQSDTSLVECHLHTGRTHQLRLHLQFLGNPIANDPCYGGDLFYGEPGMRQQALELLQDMNQRGYHLLSKPPHLDADMITELPQNSTEITNEGLNLANTTSIESPQLPDESDNDYLIRTCRYCNDSSSLEKENSLHCNGIWLHALRFKNGDKWSFETNKPVWAKPFETL